MLDICIVFVVIIIDIVVVVVFNGVCGSLQGKTSGVKAFSYLFDSCCFFKPFIGNKHSAGLALF